MDDHSLKKQLYFNPFLWQDDEVSSLVLQQSFILNFFKVLPKTPLFQGQNPLLYKADPALLTFFCAPPRRGWRRLKIGALLSPFPSLIMVIFSNDFDHEEVQYGNLIIFLLLKIYEKPILDFKMAVSEVHYPLELISRKKLSDRKIIKFPHCWQRRIFALIFAARSENDLGWAWLGKRSFIPEIFPCKVCLPFFLPFNFQFSSQRK